MISEQQLKEWEEMEKRATPGPWDSISIDSEDCTGWAKIWKYGIGKEFEATEQDFKIMCMARTALPLLIEENKELRNIIRVIGNVLKEDSRCFPREGLQEIQTLIDRLGINAWKPNWNLKL